MKRFFWILGLCGLGVSLFAESPSYFRDPDSKNGRFRPDSSVEERYQYLYGKRVTVEEKLAFLYDDTITYHKQNSSVWDLVAKDWLLWDLRRFVKRGLTVDATEEEREGFRDSRMRALEMMTNLYREIFEEYRSGEDETIEKQLREQIGVFIKTRSEEDRKAYLRTMFLRDRNNFISTNILVSLHRMYYITALVGNFRDDPSRMLDYYDRSLLIKGSGTKLSGYVRRQHPREKQLISLLEELEHAREKEIVEKEKPSSVPKKNEEEVKSGESKIYKERIKNPLEKGIRDDEGGSRPPFAYPHLKSRLIGKVSKSRFMLPEYKQGMREKEVLLLINSHISFRLERIPYCSFEDDLFFYFWNDLTPRAGEAVYKETGEVIGWGQDDFEVND